MKKLFLFIICPILFLTGCWNNIELDSEALVHGVGLDKAENKEITMSVEIVQPTPVGADGAEQSGAAQKIILETEAESILDGARKMIRSSKRRLYFGHSRVGIIGDELAKKDLAHHLDIIRRDQMFRVGSYLFITKEDPRKILEIPTLYENLTSTELISALEQIKFSKEFTPIRFYEFFRLIEGPVAAGYVPIIKITQKHGEKYTELDGTAVINKNKYVGELNSHETVGLSWLINDVQGGSITVKDINDHPISLEITTADVKFHPNLKGKDLDVDIEVKVEGTLADNMTKYAPTEEWFEKIADQMNAHVKGRMRQTLKKLQKELKTDITNIGPKTHQKFPKEWSNIYSEYDEVFSNANIHIDVETKLVHKGLINKSKDPQREKPHNNPYRF